MVDTIKFSQMTNAGNVNNNDIMPSLRSGENVILNNPWTFLPPGTTADRPAPSSTINYRLRFNTDDEVYEYYNAVIGTWVQLEQSTFISGPFITYTADVNLPDAQNLGALANGILKQTIAMGSATLGIAVQGTDYYGPGDNATFSGITMTGDIDMGGFTAFNAANPINPQDYATKFYVDQTALNGTSVYAASTSGWVTAVTQAGSGVGATLTNAGTQAVFALDGVNPSVGDNVLIKDFVTGMNPSNEGIYTVVDVGSVSTNWQLIRASSYNTPVEVNNTGLIAVRNGSTLAGTAWYNTATIVALDVTFFNYAQFGNIIFPVVVSQGGTGFSSTTPYGILAGGTTSTGAFQNLGTGTSGQMLVSAGASALAAWTTATGTGAPVKQDSPRLINTINDVNGNGMLAFNPLPSAVNFFQIANAATGNGPEIAVNGSDTNASMSYRTKGTGTHLFLSANATNPMSWYSGTSYLHLTNWITANTAVTRNVTLPDASGTIAFTTDVGVTRVVEQVFTSSGTYTPTSGMICCWARAVGGGGSGGGAAGNTSQICVGAGGGSGGYSEGMFTAATIGASQTVTIGAGGASPGAAAGNPGGNTSLGSLLIANGGTGGGAGVASATLSRATQGNGGTAGTGSFTSVGTPGTSGFSFTVNAGVAGNGGSSVFGGGGIGFTAAAGSNNGNAGVRGGGGSGAVAVGLVNGAGGAGGDGEIIILEFCL